MSDYKKESPCANNCFNNSCCNFVNEAIAAYYRDATTAFTAALAAIIAAFPFPVVTAAQIAAITANCAAISTIVAGVPLTGAQADAVNTVSGAFGGPTTFVAGSVLTPAQVASLTGLCAAFSSSTAGAPIAPGSALATSFAAFLDAFVGAGAGAAFLASLTTIATERTARIVALKTKFDDINRTILCALQKLLDSECNTECCQSAADAIRVTAINFLRLAIATAINPAIPVLPLPPVGVAPAPGSLQFLLANYDRELLSAIRVIVSSVGCFEEDCDDFCDEPCEPCFPCDRKVRVKPTRKVQRQCKDDEKKECDRKWTDDHDSKKFEEEKSKCFKKDYKKSDNANNSWKYDENNLKW